MRHRLRTVLVMATAALAIVVTPAVAHAAPIAPVASMETATTAAATVPVYRFYSPTFEGHFYTTDPAERDRVITQLRRDWSYEGIAYQAFSQQQPGTVPLYRFWSEQFHGHFYTADPSERDRVVRTWPDIWSYEGVAYYVYPADSSASDTTSVYRFWGPSVHHHFYTASDAERAKVVRTWPDVWSYEGVGFKVPKGPAVVRDAVASGPGDGDGVFTVVTYPDTQQEVFGGTRFRDRSSWLVSQRDALDLRFVMHTGDVVNWDTDDHSQYVNARAGMQPLTDAGIPYQLSIGNHDTMATGPGGGARDSKRTREYQRTTTTFNTYFPASAAGGITGQFEAGKVDNTFSTFSAEGVNWLVLNLELWPRAAVVDWAEQVISSHPYANVVIQTHSFLDPAAGIDGAGQSATRWSYGDSSPQYVYDRLVGPYENVKLVTSGHVGYAASTTVKTARGNTVAYLLQALHSNTTNPVRLTQIDVRRGTMTTKVYAPLDGAVWDSNVLSGLKLVQP